MTLPTDVSERLAGEPLSAFLATSADDRPHVAPVWYLAYEGYIWLFTGGRKLANIRANPRVALAIEQSGDDGWLAVCRGTVTVVDDVDTREDVASRLFSQYLDDGEQYRTESGEPTGTLVRIDVGSVDFRDQ